MAYHHHDLRRTLIDSALDLLSEQQTFDFSLREVARRAGVSHNAPYNHFADKRDLLAEVAASGFRSLEQTLFQATNGERDQRKALVALAESYLMFAGSNPALYRLMFGPTLAEGHATRPDATIEAGATTKTVLVGLLKQGASAGDFAFDPNDAEQLEIAHLTTWATLHGLASLLVDRKAETSLSEISVGPLAVELLLNGLNGWKEKR